MQLRYGRRLRQAPGSGLAAWIFVAALSSIAFARPDPYDAAVEASSFSPQRALTFGLFSKIMYCDPTSIEEWSCPPCQRVDPTFSGKVFANSSTDFLALVGSNDGNIVVAFRGSDNLENWIKDMEFFHQNPYSKCSGCEVHGGFTSTWESVRGPVMDEVERLVGQQPNAKVFVTGHSLGAAVAVLAAADLGASAHSLGYPIEGVYTYGQPRVGNKAFREFYETGEHVSFRLTHWKDIVPHLPPKGMDDYYHTSTEVFYTEDSSQYTICDGSGEDPKCSDQFMLPDSLEDHRTYLNLNITYCTGP